MKLRLIVPVLMCVGLWGCDKIGIPQKATGMPCEARPSDQRISSALNSELGKAVSIIGVNPSCNSAMVMYEDGTNWRQASVIGFDNGTWVLAIGNPFSGTKYSRIP